MVVVVMVVMVEMVEVEVVEVEVVKVVVMVVMVAVLLRSSCSMLETHWWFSFVSLTGQLKDALTQRHRQQVALGISENMVTPSTPDLQEEKLRSQLEEEKTRYKTTFMRLKALKVEIEHLQLLMDKAKVKLQKEFEVWWAEEATNLQVNSPATNPQELLKPVPQHDQPQLLLKKSSQGREAKDGVSSLDICCDRDARRILPSPCPSQHSQEPSSSRTQLQDSICERPMSSIPLTGDSQTDSDILAFIKARQNILQKKCKNIPWKPAKARLSLLFSPTLGGSRKLQRKEGAAAVVWVASYLGCSLSPEDISRSLTSVL
ncbi:hypothetical protein U0070_021033 [Myodes glareolus]|uniref:Kinesin-like protein KIF6/9 C-terminal domain-containing protein n=1 Tax=Myodes glareolus TaxID=447135 RepID=A0AAW0HQZ4_MYOGA